MSKLYFRYGAMGSSKSANALMVEYNYRERGKRALLAKPKADTREEGVIHSRIGLEQPCISVEELMMMKDEEISKYDAVIVDEAQFCSKEDIKFLVHIADDLDVPVICYGLRTDFQGELFEGSKWLLAWADEVEEIKTVCWCGKKATCNARIDAKGRLVRTGEQVEVGANEKYVALCRKHFNRGVINKTAEDKLRIYSAAAKCKTRSTFGVELSSVEAGQVALKLLNLSYDKAPGPNETEGFIDEILRLRTNI